MLSGYTSMIFYSVCGAIVAWMLIRIWRKGRVPTNVSIVTPVAKSRMSPPDVPAAPVMARTTNDAPSTSVPPVPVSAPVTQVATSALKSEYERGPTRWDGRRLLETQGLLPKNTNTMPQVLSQDVPGVADDDRTFGSMLNPAFASMLPESGERRKEARRDLMSAGYYNPHAVENLAATRYVLMMLGLIFCGALLLLVPPQLEAWVIAGCLLAPLLGWALPALYVRGKARDRKREIERAMPDLLDMMNMCVGQGLTVPDSMQRVGRDFRSVYPALSQELGIVNEQAKISTMHTALENFSRRIDLPEVHSFTSLLIQTERMGTSISQALTTYSDTMRENQRQQADEKGNRATFRLLFPTVLCLMPAVYLFLLGPAVNELQKFFYAGGLDSLSSSSQVVQRVNATRNRSGTPGRSAAGRAGQ